MSELTKRDCVIMFVDMVGSTELKYREQPDNVARLILDFVTIINENTPGRDNWKFTGDGAMVIYRKHPAGCNLALRQAEQVIQAMDRHNLLFTTPHVQIRVGIASGRCYILNDAPTEVSGTTADLAARLCSEADPSTVLLDELTKTDSQLPKHRFFSFERHIALKGVPLPSDKAVKFYYLKTHRLIKPPSRANFSKGLLALYGDRGALLRDFTPTRILHLAGPRTDVLAVGRTLISWTGLRSELLQIVREKGIKFSFLINSIDKKSDWIRFLDPKQAQQIEEDLPKARKFFTELAQQDPEHIEVRETDQLILDGILCAHIALPGGADVMCELPRLIALQDINAAPQDHKAAFMLACTCSNLGDVSKTHCLAHGLLKRTQLLFRTADIAHIAPILTPLETLLNQHQEGIASRNNTPSQYLRYVLPHLRAIKAGEYSNVPPPLTVQIQVSAKCSTHCVMCHHYLDNKWPNEMSLDDWTNVFHDLGEWHLANTPTAERGGVPGRTAVIFSGGEPLMRDDICDLLSRAKNSGLKIGMLTNGTMLHKSEAHRRTVIKEIRNSVDWVAISIDGPQEEDELIRHPEIRQRRERLQEFCNGLKNGGPKVSATVTLQTENIDMDIEHACRFINEIGIPDVNFKLATGATRSLAKRPNYLVSGDGLRPFIQFLWNHRLPQERGNNLAYLRRCFAKGMFRAGDVEDGAPVASFYTSRTLRCFSPFVFSLIDSNGDVYPCCHLYRDNHGHDEMSKDLRRMHLLGNVNKSKFSEIWNNLKYQQERRKLETIRPYSHGFVPCGECTRHCQHNHALSEIYLLYADNLAELDKLTCELNRPGDNVWF
jgi:MoaA/NifB/PqqE/SkfB family radical SAM enzyme/class 3 adenylate cyclase